MLPEPGSFELHEALEIHLFAAEPDVVDPVALAFDAAERMYVVEMRDYPLGMPPDGRPGGTLRLLEDLDSDGRADRSTVFAEGLSFPTSIAPWKAGVFVTAPPQVLYLEDRDGDRRADHREVVFDGFTLGVTDSGANGLRWAIDNRIHGANGGNGGQVGETSLRGLDFRFDPRTRVLETTYQTAGGFGLVFDPWGRSFAPYNIDHLQQRVIPVRYLSRDARLPPLDATVNVSVHGAMARIFPISAPTTRPNHPEQAGHYSAAGGIGWLDFAGDDLPRGVLVCDVVGNLVSREVPRDEGPVLATERAPEEREGELFASRDPAFRPIGVEMGPEGALYLIDMQRDTIEHPDYIAESRRRGLDLRAGSERGRIYRIVPRRGLPRVEPPLADLPSERLAAELASPNRWRRDTAQRLLYERGDAPLAALRALVLDAGADSGEVAALGRLHALWTLDGAGTVDEPVLLAALADGHPGVRENALLVAERLVGRSSELEAGILALAYDPSARVRFQAALTLGGVAHPRRAAALDRILRRDAGYRWTRIAVESALGDDAVDVLESLLRSSDAWAPDVVRELADLVGAGFDRSGAGALERILDAALEAPVSPAVRTAALEGLAAGVARVADPPTATPSIGRLLDRATESSPPAARFALRLRRSLRLEDGPVQQRLLAGAAARARDRSLPVDERSDAVDLLALGAHDRVVGDLSALLAANEPGELQARSIRALAGFDDETLGRRLVAGFRGLGPAARSAALGVLLRRPAFHADLVGALEAGRLTAGELHLDLEQRRRLLRSDAAGVAERAARLLDDDDYGNRSAVVESWLERLPASGSSERGRAVFERLCAQCHLSAAGDGHQVGPPLASLSHRSAEDLVSSILDPDLAIHPDYVAFEVTLRSGASEVGLVESESGTALVLLQAGGERRVIPRDQVTSIASTGRSLMPNGLDQGLDPQGLRDVVALIQNGDADPGADHR